MTPKTRTRVGFGSIVLGVVLLVVGIIGVMGTDEKDASASPVATTSPAPISETTPPAVSPSTTVPPPPPTTTIATTTTSLAATTTTVPPETAEAFLALLVEGLRGDTDFLISRLNPATIAIYGEEQCRTALSALLDPEAELEIREVGEAGPWDYVIDNITTPIPDATPIEVQRLAQGQTLIQELHWQLIDSQWTWFTDCGDPLAS